MIILFYNKISGEVKYFTMFRNIVKYLIFYYNKFVYDKTMAYICKR